MSYLLLPFFFLVLESESSSESSSDPLSDPSSLPLPSSSESFSLPDSSDPLSEPSSSELLLLELFSSESSLELDPDLADLSSSKT